MIHREIDWSNKDHKFDFCSACHFFPCELVPEYEHFQRSHQGIPTGIFMTQTDDSTLSIDQYLSYDKNELCGGCPMFCKNGSNVYQVECGSKRVSEGIGDHYKIDTDYNSTIRTGVPERWEPSQPVFISAQTGQGKNFFIENTLIPYIKELNNENQTNQKILILSNRLALKQQIKKRLMSGSDSDSTEDSISYGLYADTMTFQSLLRHENYIQAKQKNGKTKYLYVVCDEAHFFTSDAMFNPHTKKILEKIVFLFRDAIRIYMSATPYDCLEYIIRQEKTQPKYEPLVLYHFTRDYGYLDVKGYSEFNEISEVIAKSVLERKEKWLVFIDNLNECERLRTSLATKEHGDPKMSGKVEILHAANKENETYISIVSKEKLNKDTYVLISTSVLDNGVNFRDIANIVVSDIQKVKVLQMAGRARVSNSTQRKTLYIKRHSKKSLDNKIEYLRLQKLGYHEYDMAYAIPRNLEQSRGYDRFYFLDKYYQQSTQDWERAKHWFGISREDCTHYINEIARSLMEQQLNQYENIREEMENEETVGQKYLEYQFSWFGKRYSKDDDITYQDKCKAEKSFEAFLKRYVENNIIIDDSEKMEEFSKEFIRLFDAAFHKSDRNKRIYGAVKMNRLLKKVGMGYVINGKAQKGPWSVCEVGLDTSDLNMKVKVKKTAETEEIYQSNGEVAVMSGATGENSKNPVDYTQVDEREMVLGQKETAVGRKNLDDLTPKQVMQGLEKFVRESRKIKSFKRTKYKKS